MTSPPLPMTGIGLKIEIWPSQGATDTSKMRPYKRASFVARAPSTDTDENVALKWKQLFSDAQSAVDNLIRRALPQLTKANSDINVSTKCVGSLLQVIVGIRGLKTWAVQMLDSWGRPPAGLLRGTITDLGDYDECLDVRHHDYFSGREKFRGQYCTINTRFKLPQKPLQFTFSTKFPAFENISTPGTIFHDLIEDLPLLYRTETRYGICIPSSCSQDDISTIVHSFLANPATEIEVKNCEISESSNVTLTEAVILAVLGAYLLLIFVCTGLDVCFNKYQSDNKRLGLIAMRTNYFSMQRNMKILLNAHETQLKSIDGIRFFSMGWLLLAHTYVTLTRDALAGQKNIKSMVQGFGFQIIANPTLSVDTFFLLSGILITFHTLRMLEKTNGKFDVVIFILRRIWRLIPPLLLTFAFLYLLPLLGSGPLFQDVIGSEIRRCQKTWWATVFLASSWLKYEDMCIPHAWYLSVDIQLYLLLPVVLILLHRKPQWGFILIGFYIMAGSVVMAALTVIYDLYPSYLCVTPDEQLTALVGDLTYYKPYAHVGPYFIGVIVGYILQKYPKITLRPLMVTTCWCASLSVMFATLFGTYNWHNGHLPSQHVAALNQATSRLAWSVGAGWMVFACVAGYGGMIGDLLSLDILRPLGRLSYTMYLQQFLVMWLRNGLRRQRLHLSHFNVVCEFFIYFVATLFLSVIGYLIAEAPFISLDAVIFKRSVVKQPSSNATGQVGPPPNCPDILVDEEKKLKPSITRL